MQQAFGVPVVATEIGGVSGGGATLTELGATLLKTYRRIETRAGRAIEQDLEVLAGMVKADAPPRRAKRAGKAARKA